MSMFRLAKGDGVTLGIYFGHLPLDKRHPRPKMWGVQRGKNRPILPDPLQFYRRLGPKPPDNERIDNGGVDHYNDWHITLGSLWSGRGDKLNQVDWRRTNFIARALSLVTDPFTFVIGEPYLIPRGDDNRHTWAWSVEDTSGKVGQLWALYQNLKEIREGGVQFNPIDIYPDRRPHITIGTIDADQNIKAMRQWGEIQRTVGKEVRAEGISVSVERFELSKGRAAPNNSSKYPFKKDPKINPRVWLDEMDFGNLGPAWNAQNFDIGF